jgi:hypothetical protein
VQEVEHEVRHRHPLDQATDRDRVDDVHPLLQPAEVGPPGVWVERHYLAVEDGGDAAQQVSQDRQLRVGAGHLVVVARQDPQAGATADVRDEADAVPLHLVRPRLLLAGSGQLAGGGEHRPYEVRQRAHPAILPDFTFRMVAKRAIGRAPSDHPAGEVGRRWAG